MSYRKWTLQLFFFLILVLFYQVQDVAALTAPSCTSWTSIRVNNCTNARWDATPKSSDCKTSSREVTLHISSANATRMAFANTNTATSCTNLENSRFSNPVTYNSRKSWNLNATLGDYKVCVRLINAAGTSKCGADITLIRVHPTPTLPPAPTSCFPAQMACSNICGQTTPRCVTNSCGGNPVCCPTTAPCKPSPPPTIYCNNPNIPCPFGYRCESRSSCPPGVACIASVIRVCVPVKPTITPTPPTPTFPPCATRIRGDANCNGTTDPTDFLLFRQALNGQTLTCANCSADFNGDGKVNVMDYELWRSAFYSSTPLVPVTPIIHLSPLPPESFPTPMYHRVTPTPCVSIPGVFTCPTAAPCVDVPGGPICGGG